MIFVDPLFQRTLISTIREDASLISPNPSPSTSNPTSPSPLTWTGLPIIADEVFTGLFRLGRASSSSFLSQPASDSSPTLTSTIAPDISVHAKLLTAGLLPLAITTASASIFDTFVSDRKPDALLHGHSYTAHAVGCAVANRALPEMQKLDTPPMKGERAGKENVGWEVFKSQWGSTSSSCSSAGNLVPASNAAPIVFSFFSPATLVELSHHEKVASCFAVGTVLALTLQSKEAGYTSTATASLQARLLTTLDSEGAGVHSRVLGDVIYFMTSLTTTVDQVMRLEQSLIRALDMDN